MEIKGLGKEFVPRIHRVEVGYPAGMHLALLKSGDEDANGSLTRKEKVIRKRLF